MVTVLFSDVTDPKKAAYTAIYDLAAKGVVKGTAATLISTVSAREARW